MKKILFMAICCLLVAGSVSAQEYYYGPRRPPQHQYHKKRDNDFYRVRAGVTGSLNLANTIDAYDYNYSTGTIAAFSAGLFLDVPVVFPFSFEPEVLYSQKGFTAQTTDGNLTSRSGFIDVPLLAKFKLAPGFNFLIGPQISFLTSTTNTYSNGFTPNTQDNYNYNGNNVFLDSVVGVSFDVSPDVEIRARYTIDLTENDGNGSYTPDYRNQLFQIGLGFKFE